jgi:surface antigen
MRLSFPFRFCFAICISWLLAGCALGGFSSNNASGHYTLWQPQQCAVYAREVSGIQLHGDANDWWRNANPPRYGRSRYPIPGSVLVLASTSRMPHGHLAVVKCVINRREIDVTQSNWGSGPVSRRAVYESMRVQDISPRNDWSSVHFWNYQSNSFGFPYAVRGFIYQH